MAIRFQRFQRCHGCQKRFLDFHKVDPDLRNICQTCINILENNYQSDFDDFPRLNSRHVHLEAPLPQGRLTPSPHRMRRIEDS